MKKLLLCGFAVLAFSLTPAVKADVVLLDDDITTSNYTDGASIDGINGWSNAAGTINFAAANLGMFHAATANDTIATHSLAAPGAGDTQLSALFFGRLRPDTGFKTLIALNDGSSNVLVFGANQTGDYVSGTGISTYTGISDPFNSAAHAFHQLRLTYDEAGGGTGSLFAAPDLADQGTSFGSEVLVATFTGTIDVSSLQSLLVVSSSNADRVGTINAQSITPIPEPCIVALGLICITGLATRRRRHERISRLSVGFKIEL